MGIALSLLARAGADSTSARAQQIGLQPTVIGPTGSDFAAASDGAIAPATQPATQPSNIAPASGRHLVERMPATQPATRPSDVADTSATQPATNPSEIVQATTEPAPVVIPPEIAALIAKLGDTDFTVRETAQAALVKMGAGIDPILRQTANDASDPEIRQRAAAAIYEIAENIANEPAYITLHVKNEDPQVVAREISRQGNVPISANDPQMWTRLAKQHRVTLDLDRVPFWDAMIAFCNQADCQPGLWGNGRTLQLFEGKQGSLLAGKGKDCGRVIVTPMSAFHNENINYASGNISRNDMLTLAVYADPKLRILNYDSMPLMDLIEDEKHNSLLGPIQQTGIGSAQGLIFQVNIPLQYPPNVGTKIARLKGNLEMLTATKTATVEFDDLAKSVGTKKTSASRTVELKEFAVDGNHNARVHLVFSRTPVQNFGMDDFNQIRDITITDSDGNVMQSSGGSMGGNNQQIDWQQNFQVKPGAKLNLTWQFPTEMKELEIPFELDDLQLPPK
jgi:hypothetical protein